MTDSDANRRLITGLIVMGITIVVGTVGYEAAGWPWLEALYMVVITIFSVGYGEVIPITEPALKIFTIALIIVGCTTLIYLTGAFIQLLTQGEIRRALGGRRMTREITTLDHHAIICGFGRVGQIMAAQLAAHAMAFVVVDPDPERTRRAEERGWLVVTGNGTNDDVLRDAGVERARFLATALPDDSANVFITLSAHALNPELLIIARGEHPDTEQKLMRAGAWRVILPTATAGTKMANFITHPTAEEFFQRQAAREHLNEDIAQLGLVLQEVPVTKGSSFVGSDVADLHHVDEHPAILVGVRRRDGHTTTKPPGDLTLEIGDTIILMGRTGENPAEMLTVRRKKEMRYRGAST